MVIDRTGGQVMLGHPERLLDTPQLVIGANDELGTLAGQIGRVALDSCQLTGLASNSRFTDRLSLSR